jgi:hypothetical protein
MYMNTTTKQRVMESIQNFCLPRYHEIPNVGLYLDQTTKYISEYLAPLGDYTLTNSMVSNYVKKGLIASPVKKQYDRDQIAYLFFIAVAKSVLSLDALTGFIALQKRTYSVETAYNFFCKQMEGTLRFTCELTDVENVGELETTDEKRLLYSCIISVTQKIYLEKCLEAIAAEIADGV